MNFILVFLVALIAFFSVDSSGFQNNVSDVKGEISDGSVLGVTTITISADFDGETYDSAGTGFCSNTGSTIRTESSLRYRNYIRFPLAALPAGVTVTNVDFQYRVTTALASAASDVQAYNQNGQADPQPDTVGGSCNSLARPRTANDPSPYFDEQSLYPSTGLRTLTLPSEALADIQNANVAGIDRFSLAINEGASSSSSSPAMEAIENSGTQEPKLIISYYITTPDPPTLVTTPSVYDNVWVNPSDPTSCSAPSTYYWNFSIRDAGAAGSYPQNNHWIEVEYYRDDGDGVLEVGGDDSFIDRNGWYQVPESGFPPGGQVSESFPMADILGCGPTTYSLHYPNGTKIWFRARTSNENPTSGPPAGSISSWNVYSFGIDTGDPSVSISNANSVCKTVGGAYIAGDGTDDFSGVGRVNIAFERSSDGLYWNWSAGGWNAALGSPDAWFLHSIPSPGTNISWSFDSSTASNPPTFSDSDDYTAFAQGVDEGKLNGNTQASAVSQTFTYGSCDYIVSANFGNPAELPGTGTVDVPIEINWLGGWGDSSTMNISFTIPEAATGMTAVFVESGNPTYNFTKGSGNISTATLRITTSNTPLASYSVTIDTLATPSVGDPLNKQTNLDVRVQDPACLKTAVGDVGALGNIESCDLGESSSTSSGGIDLDLDFGTNPISIDCPAANDCKIFYNRFSNQSFTFVDCNGTNCASNNSSTIRTSVGNVATVAVRCPAADDCKGLFHDRIGGDIGIYFADCNNAACSSPTITAIDTSLESADVNSIDLICPAADDCKIVYLDTGTPPGDEVTFVDCNNATCSSRTFTVVHTNADNVAGLALDCPAATDCKIAYAAISPGNLIFTDCNNATCSSSTSSIVDNNIYLNNGLHAHVDISCPAADDCKIIYQKDQTGELRFADCNNATCSVSVKSTLASGLSNLYTAMECPSSGNCKIVYNDGTDVVFANCNDSACSAPVLTILDSVGGLAHVALDCPAAADCKVIYGDAAEADLTFIDCLDASCTGIGDPFVPNILGADYLVVANGNIDSFYSAKGWLVESYSSAGGLNIGFSPPNLFTEFWDRYGAGEAIDHSNNGEIPDSRGVYAYPSVDEINTGASGPTQDFTWDGSGGSSNSDSVVLFINGELNVNSDLDLAGKKVVFVSRGDVNVLTSSSGSGQSFYSFPYAFHADTDGINFSGSLDNAPGVQGNVFSNANITGNLSGSGNDITGDAYSTGTINPSLTISGSRNESVPAQNLPFVDTDYWKNQAFALGGEIPASGCCTNTTIGPVRINGNVTIGGSETFVAGVVHITGDLTIDGAELTLTSDYWDTATGTVVVVDGKITITDKGKINRTGTVDGKRGFILLASTKGEGVSPTPVAIDVDGPEENSTAIYYAPYGEFSYARDDFVNYGTVAAKKITHHGDAPFRYSSYFQNAQFSPAPSAPAPSAVGSVDGLFVTQGIFNSGSCSSNNTSCQLVINGGIIAGGGVNLGRNLGAANTTDPSEIFNYDPSYIYLFATIDPVSRKSLLGLEDSAFKEVEP